MSMIAEVVAATGASREDVVRVATHGGVGDADRAIAEAIEAAGGRRAADMMVAPWQAEHERLQKALWAETREEDIEFLRHHAESAGIHEVELLLPGVVEDQPAAAPMTNPHAVYDPEVQIYPENTSPEDTNRIAPHHPGAHDEDNLDEHDDEVAAEHLAAQVHGDLAEVLDDAVAAARLTTAWSTPAEGRRTLAQVLMTHPAPRIRAQLEAGLAAA